MTTILLLKSQIIGLLLGFLQICFTGTHGNFSPKWRECSDEFWCSNGECVDGDKVCDEDDDCGDWSDERSCNDDVCDEGMFYCGRDQPRCIIPQYVCDGIYDCQDKRDEEDCPSGYPDNSYDLPDFGYFLVMFGSVLLVIIALTLICKCKDALIRRSSSSRQPSRDRSIRRTEMTSPTVDNGTPDLLTMLPPPSYEMAMSNPAFVPDGVTVMDGDEPPPPSYDSVVQGGIVPTNSSATYQSLNVESLTSDISISHIQSTVMHEQSIEVENSQDNTSIPIRDHINIEQQLGDDTLPQIEESEYGVSETTEERTNNVINVEQAMERSDSVSISSVSSTSSSNSNSSNSNISSSNSSSNSNTCSLRNPGSSDEIINSTA